MTSIKLPTNPIARKLLMALSATVMVGFVLMHLLGNATIFAGADALNAYAHKLSALGPALWVARLVLVTALCTHACVGFALYLMNLRAKSAAYEVTTHQTSTLSSRTMPWSGLFIGAFIVWHLVQFTFQWAGVPVASRVHMDAMGRADVHGMVSTALALPVIASIYLIGMVALGLHLYHGLQSMAQTLGLVGQRVHACVVCNGRLGAALIALGFALIPLTILLGVIR